MDQHFSNEDTSKQNEESTTPKQESEDSKTSQQAAGGNANGSDGGSKMWMIGGAVIVAIIIIVLALYTVSGGGLTGGDSSRTVASVNGEAITQSELDERFNQSKQALESRGSQVSKQQESQLKQQILQSLINEELLLQAAADAGVDVSDSDIQSRIDQVKSQFEGDGEFEKQLANNNLSLDEFKTTIREQMLVQGYLEDNISTSSVSVTDEEIQQQYEQLSSQASEGQQVPPLSQVRPMLEQRIQQQKLQQQRQAVVDELRQDAEIQTNL